jgi:hypothetical protein
MSDLQNPLAPPPDGAPWLQPPQNPLAPPPSAAPTPEPEPPRRAAPTPDAVTETHRYYAELREDLLRRVGELEQFFGFAAQAEELAVRVAKLESFVFGRR